MAKDNHRTVGLKGSTHSISYNVRTTTFTVLGSAVQANTTPMQKPDSGTGQTWLSSAVLTAHNILLPEGVISRCTAVIEPIVFRQERIYFYPKIVILQAFAYKVAKPREATRILVYQTIIPTQKWKSSASKQQSVIPLVRSDKKSTKSYVMQRQEIKQSCILRSGNK